MNDKRGKGFGSGSPDWAYMDRIRFPVDPWRLTESFYSSDDLGTTETLFAVGNGYLGMRGNVDEGRESHSNGTFINGFHETWPIQHAEEAYGFARVGQTIVNAPDAKVIRLYVDDEPLLLSVADLISYERVLDFADGVLHRRLVWRTPSGNRVQVRSRRMVSLVDRHLAVMTFEVTVLDRSAPVAISSQLLNRQDGLDEYRTDAASAVGVADPRRAGSLRGRVLQPEIHWQGEDRTVLGYRCTASEMTIAVAADHVIESDCEIERLGEVEADFSKRVFRTRAEPGQTITLAKTVSYHTSRNVPARELVSRCRRTLDRARDEGIEQKFGEQRAWLTEFWGRSDVQIEGRPELQQAIRWNVFQLAQAGARAEGQGIPAKGVTGSGYGGHYFWDTEVYVVPFFIYTSPLVARNLLRFRYTMLPAARRRAQDLTQEGALFPWRTINGEESSAYYAAGTAQYHIDADIAYAVSKYVDATGDIDFLAREGVDILVETARMWAYLGFWRGNGEATFRIHGVTGPDEYTTVVNDNLYTNVMARFNLQRAARAVRELERQRPQDYSRMVSRLALRAHEVDEWVRAAEAIAIPWDDALGIHPQDAQFHEREVWDLQRTPPEKLPLLLHYHPLVIYRFQVLKQADVVLALFLQGDRFSEEEKRADFEYYDGITTGDSTLSGVVQSIIAAEVGYHELALRYFHDALHVDLSDLHGNTSDGVHVASAGGVWSALVFGFAGMRDYAGDITFDPRLPEGWGALSFRMTLAGTRLRIEVRQESIAFQVEVGSGATVRVRGELVEVTDTAPVVVPLTDQGPRLPGEPEVRALRETVRADGTVITASVPGLSR